MSHNDSRDEEHGCSSPVNTRIPRVWTPTLQRSALSQKPPPGGITLSKPRQTLGTGKKTSGSAPTSRCASPVSKTAKSPRGSLDKGSGSPLAVRRAPGSPSVKRSIGIASPGPRRSSLPKNGGIVTDRPPSPGLPRAKTQKLAARPPRPPGDDHVTETGSPRGQGQQGPTRRVPTPMVQRKDLGAYSDIPRNRTPILSLANKSSDGTDSMVKAKSQEALHNGTVKSETALKRSSLIFTPQSVTGKENRIVSSQNRPDTLPGVNPKDNAVEIPTEATMTSPDIPSPTTSSSSITITDVTPRHQPTVLQNANNNPQIDPRTHSRSMSMPVMLQNGNFVGPVPTMSPSDKVQMDYLEKQMRRRSTGFLAEQVKPSDRHSVQRRSLYDDVGSIVVNGHTDHPDRNMNHYPSSVPVSFTRTSSHHYTPATSSSLQRSSISMSLPILSNSHYTQSALLEDSKYNNNNIKNLLNPLQMSSSKLTDVIPKNAGEELSTPNIDDEVLFGSGQHGFPVILPDALELGGQGLCENCDEVKSPDSPSMDLPQSSECTCGSLTSRQSLQNGFIDPLVEQLTKSQSCPNLVNGTGFFPLPNSPQVFLESDVVYEKYPPIRSLDVNKLDHYAEEQLREYYVYLQELQRKNGWADTTENSGQEVQRISVVEQLPGLLGKENHTECMRRVVPKIREVLHVTQPDMQLAACSAFLQILQQEKVPLQNYTQTFLQTILTSIDNRDPEVAHAWMDTLLDVIDLLPKDIIKKDILSLAIQKGQLSQSVQSRLSCCRILGKVSTKFDPFIIKKDILPVVQSLCQDVDYEVRGCMCRQLDSVARGLGLEQTKSAILPELVELTNDEESYVRLVGLETVVNVLSLLDDETCTQTIVPLVCKFCQQALANEDTTLPVVAKQLGKLCHGLSVNLTEEQRRWFIEYYQKLVKYGASESNKHSKEAPEVSPIKPVNSFPLFPSDLIEEEDQFVETRRNAGYNFPAMVMFAGVRHFKVDLFSSFHSLCSDCHYNVRRTISSGFHEVAKLLANNSSILLPEFINLLNDDSIEVLKGLISHLSDSLEMLMKSANLSASENKSHVFNELVAAILSSEGVIFASNNWRLQEELMVQMSYLPRCFTSDQIYTKFVPLMFRKLHTAKALPVKLAAAKTILLLMRQNRKFEQREEMCGRLIDELCRGNSCHQRSLFIDTCKLILELFSINFFKEYFYDCLLELATDKVPNIRLRLCPMLPKLKTLIRLPGDRNLLQLLEQYVRKILVNETDRDVLAALELAVKGIDQVQIQMEPIGKKPQYDQDLADQRKEDEEKKLLEYEEQDKKDEEMRQAKADKKKDSNKKDSSTKIPRKGSKIPAATSISKEKVPSASSRSERSSSFSGNSPQGSHGNSKTNIKRSISFNSPNKSRTPGSKESLDLPHSGRKVPPGSASSSISAGSRKGSACSVSSSSSGSSVASKARRGSIPNSPGLDVTKKTSTPTRKLSSGSVTSNGTGPASRKK